MKSVSKFIAVLACIGLLSGCVGNKMEESKLAADQSTNQSALTSALQASKSPELAASCQTQTTSIPSTCNALTATEWQYNDNGQTGIYRKQANSTNWSETTPDGRVYNFITRSSNSEYIELFDQSRDLVITLYQDKAMFRVESCTSNCPSQLLYSGRWVCPTTPTCGATNNCATDVNSPILTGNFTNGTANINWAAIENVSYYKIYRNKQVINENYTSTSFSEVTSTAANTEYNVQACNSCGKCSGLSASYFTLGNTTNQCQTNTCSQTGISTPINLTATVQNTNTAHLTWSAVNGAIKYDIFRNNIYLTTVYDQTSFDDINLSSGTFQYAVKACNNQTCSGLSAYASVTINSCSTSSCNNPCQTPCTNPKPPATNPCTSTCNQLTAPTVTTSASSNLVSLSWNAVANARNYRVFRDNAYIGSTPQHTFGDTNVVPGHSYRYHVKACNRGSCSAASVIVNVLVPATSSSARFGIRI